MSPPLVAVDLGGTNLRVARFESDQPQPTRLEKVPTQAKEGPDHVLQRMIDLIEELLGDRRAGAKIGVGVPGPLDPYQGVVIEAPNLPGWKSVAVKSRLEAHFDCPVGVGNDANLAALGEWRHGAGRGTDHLVYMTISTGIGGGVIVSGELLLGVRGLAGEVGHITVLPDGPQCGCGQFGHLEAVASGTAIARRFSERVAAGERSNLADEAVHGLATAEQIAEAAEAGDRLAAEVIKEAGRLLGHHIASLVHVFNPELIVLGGGVSEIGPRILEPIDASLRDHVMHPAYLDGLRLVRAQLGDEAGLVGAMVLASRL